MIENSFQEIKVEKLRNGNKIKRENLFIPSEHVLKLVFNYQEIIELTCLKEHLEEFILGFLFSEGIIDGIDDIENIDFSKDEKTVIIHTKDEGKGKDYRDKLKRIVTGCHGGIIQGDIKGVIRSIDSKIVINRNLIGQCLQILEEQSTGYKLTRCIHTACLFDLGANLLFKSEDLGRHNAVDKVVGFAAKEDQLSGENLIFVTGRISSEMVSKILRTSWLGIFSISSPTLDAVKLCRQFNILLAARLRPNSMIIYNQPDNTKIEERLNF